MVGFAPSNKHADTLISVRPKEKLLVHAKIHHRGDFQAIGNDVFEVNVAGGGRVIQLVQRDLLLEIALGRSGIAW